jgi:hypothetical protein
MNTCKFCGRITENRFCDKCFEEGKGKSIRDFFKDEKHLINLITRDCLTCPLNTTEFCDIIYENPQSEEEERELCQKYVKRWMDYTIENG